MKSGTARCIIIVIFLLTTGTAGASQTLAVDNACVPCHAADYRRIGPSYEELANRYGQVDRKIMADVLLARVRGGSVGAWGEMPMPAQPQGKDEDIKKLLEWMLNSSAHTAAQ